MLLFYKIQVLLGKGGKELCQSVGNSQETRGDLLPENHPEQIFTPSLHELHMAGHSKCDTKAQEHCEVCAGYQHVYCLPVSLLQIRDAFGATSGSKDSKHS